MYSGSRKSEVCPMPYALCPMPYALCPMPYALCPMPDSTSSF
ncbi:MAG: histidine kinase [Oscillatoriales cyanobacterium]|nr:MAG: histidine kinase [Oscillatoriales cyanobacterium]TAF44459.1 MAG: histidine kinase [Oscillatoriales cyanobacterium]TAF59121.1 MAG: histidine kinase [Oscillatoriales cyanobacterium]